MCPTIPTTRMAVFTVVLAFTAMGCAREAGRPEDALESFLREVSFGRAEAAWKRLTEESRDALVDRHRALAEAAGRTVDDPKPAEFLFSTLDLVVLSPAESIVVVSPPGDVVTLRVTVEGGRSAEVRMVQQGGAWRVDLMETLGETAGRS